MSSLNFKHLRYFWAVAANELKQVVRSRDYLLPLGALGLLFFFFVPVFLLGAVTNVSGNEAAEAVGAVISTLPETAQQNIQGDTEPASVEQQRLLGQTCPSLYDLRNLFQVNVEEGRHLWAMVYLLHAHFGRDGREEAEELLERRSGDFDKPRILTTFNEPIDDWLSFFMFTMFTDRDGKMQLLALAAKNRPVLDRATAELAARFCAEAGIMRPGFSFQAGAGGITLAFAVYLRDLMRSADVTARFADGQVSGQSGCNRYVARYAPAL